MAACILMSCNGTCVLILECLARTADGGRDFLGGDLTWHPSIRKLYHATPCYKTVQYVPSIIETKV